MPPKGTANAPDQGQQAPNTGEGQQQQTGTEGAGNAAQVAEVEALATRVPPKGIPAALEALQAIDPDAQVMWVTAGPRKTRTVAIGAILVERQQRREIVIVTESADGRYRLHSEVFDVNAYLGIAPPPAANEAAAA